MRNGGTHKGRDIELDNHTIFNKDLKDMMTKEQILERLRKELPKLKRSYPIGRLALFGSYSRNEQSRDSDVDILIDFDGPIGLFKIIELEGLLSDLLGIKVDLVTTSSLKEMLRPQVLKEAIYA